jgi:drug/metabolite transporter (DMT)-like permease
MLLSARVLKETVSPARLAGAALIVAGAMLIRFA